jgi:hypothetical protein
MADEFLNYDRLVEGALRGVVREALAYAADEGLKGAHHFYVSFLTGYPGVELSPQLHAKHGDEMTIVLQHQFWGLEVFDDAFEVTLSFAGVQERLHVPLAAVTAFADPSVEFGLQFKTIDGAPRTEAAADTPQGVGIEGAQVDQAAAPTEAEKESKVVTLDTFRGKK